MTLPQYKKIPRNPVEFAGTDHEIATGMDTGFNTGFNAGFNTGFNAGFNAGLKKCCVKSTNLHARHNQMVACSDCKQVLKFFREARPMQNYLKFCATSRRQVTTGLVGDYLVVAFSF